MFYFFFGDDRKWWRTIGYTKGTAAEDFLRRLKMFKLYVWFFVKKNREEEKNKIFNISEPEVTTKLMKIK